MEAAWLQVGKVLDANQRIRYGQLAKLASQVWHARTLTAMRQVSAQRMLAVSAPVQRRVLMASPVTISEMIRQSALPRAAGVHHGAANAAAAGPRVAAGWASTRHGAPAICSPG